MLKNLIFLLLLLIIVTACADTSEIESRLIGSWQVEADIFFPDFKNEITSPLEIEKGQKLKSDDVVQVVEYFEDGTYLLTQDGKPHENGTYEIKSQTRFKWVNTKDPNQPLSCEGEFSLQADKFIRTCKDTYQGATVYRKTVMVRVTNE